MHLPVPASRSLPAFLLLTLLLALPAHASDYNYMTAYQTQKAINESAKAPHLHIVDIQVEDEFAAHHLPGAIATYAYPTKSSADTAKLDAVLPVLQADAKPILVVCPGGRGGATRTVDYLVGQGIDPRRLFILKDGQSGWTYPSLVRTGLPSGS